MSQFKVEKNVPLPEHLLHHLNGHSMYPFAYMKVGDSFFVQGSSGPPSGSCTYWGKKLKMKFASHRCREKGKKGVRVWRVK